MSVALLDVNVLVALFDPAHINHETAHNWFGEHSGRGWATCAVTISGCVRILSNPVYPTVTATPAQVISKLQVVCASPHHEFWNADVSLLDPASFHASRITGHQQLTDIYLLALAVKHGGHLITYDRSIPAKAVAGAEAKHVQLLVT